MRIGVYLCQAGIGDPDAVNYQLTAIYAESLPGVEVTHDLGKLPQIDPPTMADEIKTRGLDRIVVAGDSPGFFKPAFTRAMSLAGCDPQEVRLASFREYGAASPQSTDRAKSVLACAVLGVPFPLAAKPQTSDVNPATLVVGGGVAGIQAALEIADGGKHVYLVERTGTIGGHMAQFDKTFPTLDCAACILTPKMVAIGQHEMIDLITYAEVEGVDGTPGDYRVKVRKKARRVDVEACVACHECAAVCPQRVPSEFDNGIAERKAAYMPFPQAVPNAYLIDGDSCTYVQSDGKKCGVCAKKCPKECIDLDQTDEIVELEVGNVILATGYEVYDAHKVERYGYGVFPNVLTALEFERLTNASGPTGGKIVMKTKRFNKKKKADEWVFDMEEGVEPRSIAIVHCVGSRDANHNPYCSRVCCMYSLKFAHLVKEKLPSADCYEFYIDMRAFGKGYEEFSERIKDEGVLVVRGRTAKVQEADGAMVLRGEDILGERLLETPVDMVILAVGLVPAVGTTELAAVFGLPTDQDGWFNELDYNSDPTATERGGIFVAGLCQGPKDIPDTVAQASAAAAGALEAMATGKATTSRADLSLAAIEEKAAGLAKA